jgi:hypothetical protein
MHLYLTFGNGHKDLNFMESSLQPEPGKEDFAEFRRKVRSAELLSAAIERLLRNMRFSGKLCVLVQNGRILKSAYEEGYFRQE